MSGDYLKPYADAVADAGPRFEALLWRNRESQQQRFIALAEMLDLPGRSIADMGCGRADLAVFCHERGIMTARYIGIEGVPELAQASADVIAVAGLAHACVRTGDFVADATMFDRLVREDEIDTIFFGGSLNTMPQREGERVLDRAWDALLSRIGGLAQPAGAMSRVLVFNFLSDRFKGRRRRVRHDAAHPAHRYDTARMVAWALDHTPLVRFRHDYLDGHDATVVMAVEG